MSDKTYSGVKAYHEMLVRAQALSPGLTYAMVSLLLAITIKPKEIYQESRSVSARDCPDFGDYFRDVYPSVDSSKPVTIMQSFLQQIFCAFVARGTRDDCGRDCKVIAETQFVKWLKSDVVTVDKTEKLITIKL